MAAITSIADFVIPAASLEYVKVPITATVNGSAVNPETDDVAFSFVAPGTAPSSWTTGSWETIGTTYNARILVGPGGSVTLSKGLYEVFVRVTDNPESPVLD